MQLIAEIARLQFLLITFISQQAFSHLFLLIQYTGNHQYLIEDFVDAAVASAEENPAVWCALYSDERNIVTGHWVERSRQQVHIVDCRIIGSICANNDNIGFVDFIYDEIYGSCLPLAQACQSSLGHAYVVLGDELVICNHTECECNQWEMRSCASDDSRSRIDMCT